jgi:molecular chaperone HscA
MVAGMARVEIRFEVDADGLLHVSAREIVSGNEARVDVKPSYGLQPEEIERMLLDSFEHAEDDVKARALAVERVEADRILEATKRAVAVDRELLDAEVERAIQQKMAELEKVVAEDSHLAIRNAIAELDTASKPFAELRMTRAVGQAVRGRSVADVEQSVGGR